MKKIGLILLGTFLLIITNDRLAAQTPIVTPWSLEKANAWQKKTGWVSGSNFLPSTAVNALEFWQMETFDTLTIDRELGWASDMGFNIMRVWLSSYAWKTDPKGFKDRVHQYLKLSQRHNIGTMFVFFCDCWNPDSKPGPQPPPKPGVHNSQWVQDPSCDLRTDTAALYPWLEKYVKDILSTFRKDQGILVWDLYNEPDARRSLRLLKNVFQWAREINPAQPLTTGLYDLQAYEMNKFIINNSDIITYHNYSDLPVHAMEVNLLKLYGRPMICTEWMARSFNSKFQNILPMLRRENVGAINWGLVSGKTNTIYKWGEPVPDGSEPKVWFHDILRRDGTPFDKAETDTIKAVNRQK